MSKKRKNKKSKSKTLNTNKNSSSKNYSVVLSDEQLTTLEEEPSNYSIKTELLSTDSLIYEENNMIEITDRTVLEHIDNLIPGFLQAGNSVNNAVQSAKMSSEVLYRAIIPSGMNLAKSSEIEGAVRGFYRGEKGISGQANLIAVESPKGVVLQNIAAATMNVASMVVGQYYMAKIHKGIENVNNEIAKVVNFQENEFYAKVSTLFLNVKSLMDNLPEIIENSELRTSERDQIKRLEEQCMELLLQSSRTIDNFSAVKSLDYNSYESELNKVQKWYIYQKILLEIHYNISDLRFILWQGSVSRKYCTDKLLTSIEQVQESNKKLAQWHTHYRKKFGIDVRKKRRKRQGLQSVIYAIPGVINEKHKYNLIKKKTAEMIKDQTRRMPMRESSSLNLYAKDVHLISKDGKIYYIPQDNI